jgi:chromosome segregation ATPase
MNSDSTEAARAAAASARTSIWYTAPIISAIVTAAGLVLNKLFDVVRERRQAVAAARLTAIEASDRGAELVADQRQALIDDLRKDYDRARAERDTARAEAIDAWHRVDGLEDEARKAREECETWERLAKELERDLADAHRALAERSP